MKRGGNHRTGGMLVEYNCADYQCEPGLVEMLTEIVRSDPPQVYLASRHGRQDRPGGARQTADA